jgi:hypothetical protein
MCETQTWCKTQTIPSGVLASDYQCLDFDSGNFPPAGWTQNVVSPGSLMRTNTRFFSSPNSFQSSVTLQDLGNGRSSIDWTTTASGAALKSVTVNGMLNPLTPMFAAGWPDIVDLMCIAIGDEWTYACLSYTYGSTNRTWTTSAYTGLFIRYRYIVQDAGYIGECPVSGNFVSGIWQNVELKLDMASGDVTATIEGVGSTCNPDHMAAPAPSTLPFVWLGSWASEYRPAGTGQAGWTTFYDNVVVTVRR